MSDHSALIARLREATGTDRKIVTDFVYPPIPRRDFDWVAYFEGDEEAGLRGWGTTEAEAIAELRELADD